MVAMVDGVTAGTEAATMVVSSKLAMLRHIRLQRKVPRIDKCGQHHKVTICHVSSEG